MKVIFEDEILQEQYEEIKKNLIKKYGIGCSAAYFSPALAISRLDGSKEIYIMAVFEKSEVKDIYKMIEDGNNFISYSQSLNEEDMVDEYSEVVYFER